MSVKWKTMKAVFRDSECFNGPHHQAPMIFDLIDDPTEEWDIWRRVWTAAG